MSTLQHLLVGLTLLATATTTLSSCLKEDNPSDEASTECLLTSLQLGEMSRVQYTRSHDGQRDSLIETKMNMSAYAMSIDQQQNKVYNLDSLPYNTRVKRTLWQDIKAIGLPTLQSLITGKDTVINLKQAYDFSKLRKITVWAADGQTKRVYDVEVRVHQENGDSVQWRSLPLQDWTSLNPTAPVAGQWKSSTLLFRQQGAGVEHSTDGAQWTADSLTATDAQHFPTTVLTATSKRSATQPQLETVTLYGLKDGMPCIWQRIIDLTGQYTLPWTYLPTAQRADYALPLLQEPHLLAYDGGLLLVGRSAAQQLVLRYSTDGGVHWMEHPQVSLPTALAARRDVAQLSVHLDGQQNLWFLLNGHAVWRAHLNRLSWKNIH